MNIPDVYDQWEEHDRSKERRLAQRPKCDCCDHHIQHDHWYEINGDIICPDCMESYYRKESENFDY